MKEQAYNMRKTKDSKTQRQSNLNKFMEAKFKILPQEVKHHTLEESVSLKYVFEHGSSKSTRNLASGEIVSLKILSQTRKAQLLIMEAWSFFTICFNRLERASMGIEGFLMCMLDAKSWITCDNKNRNTTLSEAQGVSQQITFDVRFHQRPTTKGVGLRVATSHTGNHREDDFTLLETIRRFLGIIGSKSLSSLKRRPSSQRGSAAATWRPMIGQPPLTWQPRGIYVAGQRVTGATRVGSGHGSGYHVSSPELNPFGYAKLITFIVMCKAYGCEPSVDLFRGFFNFFRSGKWLTFAKRPEKHIPNLLPKVITRIKGWKGRFFLVQDCVVHANYPELLFKDNRWDMKSFREKLTNNIHENHFFQRLGRYPTNVRVFPDPILVMASLKYSWEHNHQRFTIIVDGKNFMYTETDDDLTFLPKDTSLEFKTGSPSVSINTKPLIAEGVYTSQLVENTTISGDSPRSEQLVIHPGSVASRIRERKCRTRRGSLKPSVKHKLVQGASSLRSTRAKDATLKDDSPFLTIWIGKKARDQECEELKAKCEAAMADFDKNPTVNVLHEMIASLFGEVKEHRADLDRMLLENQKWTGY
nr:hypothetical protein [Tanacetum cinerariifolium]